MAYFSLCVLLILLRWFVRWEVSSRTAVVWSGAVSRICSKHQAASLCSDVYIYIYIYIYIYL